MLRASKTWLYIPLNEFEYIDKNESLEFKGYANQLGFVTKNNEHIEYDGYEKKDNHIHEKRQVKKMRVLSLELFSLAPKDFGKWWRMKNLTKCQQYYCKFTFGHSFSFKS